MMRWAQFLRRLDRAGACAAWCCAVWLLAIGSRAQEIPGTNGGTFNFTTNRLAVSERDEAALLTVTRDSIFGKMLVDVIAVDNTATNGIDYKLASRTNTLTFDNLQTAATLVIPVLDNTKTNAQGSVSAAFSLVNVRPAGGQNPRLQGRIGKASSAQLVILDDDRELEFNLEHAWYRTGEPMPTNVSVLAVNVVLAKPPGDKASEVAVDYQVTVDKAAYLKPGADFATAGEDFEEVAAGTVTFGPNDVAVPIPITIFSDTRLEFNEDFHVVLKTAHGKMTVDDPNAGTDGGGGASPPAELNYKIGKVSEATVTILFNGIPPQERAAGSVDLAFNPENDENTVPAFVTNPGANRAIAAMALDDAGNIIIGGTFSGFNGVSRGRIARLLPDGQIDLNFEVPGGINDFVTSVAAYTNGFRAGQILVGGGFTSVAGAPRNGIARLNRDGSVDASFDPGSGANGTVHAIALQRDGTILLGGEFTEFNGFPRRGIARLLEDGSVDSEFDPGAGAEGPVYAVLSIAADPITVSRTAPAGDPALFTQVIPVGAASGTLTLTYDFFADPNDIAVLADGLPIYSSGLTNHQVIVNNADGTVSTNFNPSVVVLPFTGSSLTVLVNTLTNAGTNWSFSAQIQPDRVTGAFAGGDFQKFGNVDHGRIARLNLDGTVDRAFNRATGLGADGAVRALTLQSGRLVLGGSFKAFNSFPAPKIAALRPDGSLDRTFAAGSGAQDGDIFALSTAPDNRILAGGSFTFFNETRRIFLVRLLPEGPVDTSFLDASFNQYAGFPDLQGNWPFGAVKAVLLDAAANVLVAGEFSLVGGGAFDRAEKHPRRNVARLVGGASRGPGNLEFSQKTFGADEAGGAVAATLVRSNGDLGPGKVSVSTQEASALASRDFIGETNGIVTWPSAGPQVSDGALNRQLKPIYIVDDAEVEGDENFELRLEQPESGFILGGEFIPAGFALGGVTRANAIIIDDDAAPSIISFSAPEYDVNENDGLASITVTRAGNLGAPVSVLYSTVPETGAGSAIEGQDYSAASGRVNFASGQAAQTFFISIRNDNELEQDEAVRLELFSASPGAVPGANSSAVLNIIDDDYLPGRVSLTAANYVTSEGVPAQITVRRAGGNAGILQVHYETAAGSAANFVPVSGILQWNDRESGSKTIFVPTLDDSAAAGERSFSFLLSASMPAEALGARTNATVTITDNDSAGKFAFNAAEYLADERGTNVLVTVLRRGGSAEAASVHYSTADEPGAPAISGVDYLPAAGVLEFRAGETSRTFPITVLDNSKMDAERRIGLRLASPAPEGAGLGVLSNAFVTIIDDETVNIPAGSGDTDFATGSGADDTVQAVALQRDGGVLAGGDFTVLDDRVRLHLARLDAAGNLDPDFGRDLVINGSVRAVLVQGDGRIVIGGSFSKVNGLPASCVARLTAAGTADTTFDAGSGADRPIFALAEQFLQGERKLLAGGQFSVFNGVARRGIARVNSDGRTDLSFAPGAGADGPVYAIAVQRDGKILIGGAFSSLDNKPRQGIARLNADGSLDAAFNANLSPGAVVRTLQVQFDDAILLGGSFQTGSAARNIARFDSNGALDPEFISGAGANGPVYAIALQLDGRIVLGGDFTSFSGVPANRIVRLNGDGSLDPSINFGARADGLITSLAVQPDRRIVAGGGFTTFDGLPRRNIVRIYGGSLKGAGEVEFSAANFAASEADGSVRVTVRRTGGLLGTVAVDYGTSPGTASPGADYADRAGTLTFATGENSKTFLVPLVDDQTAEPNETVHLALTNFSGGVIAGRQPAATITIMSNDRAIGFRDGSYTVNENAAGGRALVQLVRLGENSQAISAVLTATAGSAESGDFAALKTNVVIPAGQESISIGIPISDDALPEDDETILLTLSAPSAGSALARSSAVLTILDNDAAPGTLNLAAPARVSEGAGAVAVTVRRSRGKIGAISVQYATHDGTAKAGEDYLAASGTLRFQEGETSKTVIIPLIADTTKEPNEAFTIALSDPAGGALIGVGTAEILLIDDDLAAGSLDRTFDPGPGADGEIRTVGIDAQDRLWIGGSFTTYGGQLSPRLARLTPAGLLDAEFAAGAGPDDAVTDLALAAGGAFVGGRFSTVAGEFLNRVAFIKADGSPGLGFVLPLGLNGEVSAIALQPDGKILIGGTFDVVDAAVLRHLARLNRDGTVDPSFAPPGGADGNVTAFAVQPDGKILVGGSFSRIAGTASAKLARLNPNGTVDLSFQTGAGAAGGGVQDIALLADGKLLIGGDFVAYNGAARGGIVRLNGDGSADDSFSAASGVNGTIYSIRVQRDGKYLIAGDFTLIGGMARNRIARLNANGTVDGSFDPGSGADNAILAMELQHDGRIVAAGRFTHFDNEPRGGIARLHNDVTPAGGAPVFQPVTRAAGGLELRFSSEPRTAYTLESAASLSGPWVNEAGEVAAGNSAVFRIEPLSERRFFRVRRE